MDMDRDILNMAIANAQGVIDRCRAKLAELDKGQGKSQSPITMTRRYTKNASPKSTTATQPPSKKKHRMSAEGRARISAAQKARWAKREAVA